MYLFFTFDVDSMFVPVAMKRAPCLGEWSWSPKLSFQPCRCSVCSIRMDSIRIGQNQGRECRHSKIEDCVRLSMILWSQTKYLHQHYRMVQPLIRPNGCRVDWVRLSVVWCSSCWGASGWLGSSRAIHSCCGLVRNVISASSINQFLANYRRTDSTNTRRALTWIQAQKVSLKLTFNHLTSGPCLWKKKRYATQNMAIGRRIAIHLRIASSYRWPASWFRSCRQPSLPRCKWNHVRQTSSHERAVWILRPPSQRTR